MALKEYNETEIENYQLISTKQAEEKLDFKKDSIKVVYLDREMNNEYSSELSENDWLQLKTSIEHPKCNPKLASLLKRESVFD